MKVSLDEACEEAFSHCFSGKYRVGAYLSMFACCAIDGFYSGSETFVEQINLYALQAVAGFSTAFSLCSTGAYLFTSTDDREIYLEEKASLKDRLSVAVSGMATNAFLYAMGASLGYGAGKFIGRMTLL